MGHLACWNGNYLLFANIRLEKQCYSPFARCLQIPIPMILWYPTLHTSTSTQTRNMWPQLSSGRKSGRWGHTETVVVGGIVADGGSRPLRRVLALFSSRHIGRDHRIYNKGVEASLASRCDSSRESKVRFKILRLIRPWTALHSLFHVCQREGRGGFATGVGMSIS